MSIGQESPAIETNIIIHGNALQCLRRLPDNSIDCVVCSPPFWALRDYRVQGQFGLEATPDEYVACLVSVFDEVKRLLKPTGTCWVNLGDTYGARTKGDSSIASGRRHRRFLRQQAMFRQRAVSSGVPDKSLCLVPFRFALQMLRRGWICRNVVIWQKPNCLPSSAHDRFTVDFEYLFFFAKSPRYWFAPQYEPFDESTRARVRAFLRNNEAFDPQRHKHQAGSSHNPYQILERVSRHGLNPRGRNKRCVWRIPTQPFMGAHFATYPEKLVELPIRAGCPPRICTGCGKPKSVAGTRSHIPADCGCGAPFAPGIVLDPFFGAGTTGLVALKLKREFIGVELNRNYVRIAKQRLASAGFEKIRTLRVP